MTYMQLTYQILASSQSFRLQVLGGGGWVVSIVSLVFSYGPKPQLKFSGKCHYFFIPSLNQPENLKEQQK